MGIPVHYYVYKNDPGNKLTCFVTQELYKVFLQAVAVGGNDPKTAPRW